MPAMGVLWGRVLVKDSPQKDTERAHMSSTGAGLNRQKLKGNYNSPQHQSMLLIIPSLHPIWRCLESTQQPSGYKARLPKYLPIPAPQVQ